MKVFIVHYCGVIYSVFSTRESAKAYIADTWTDEVQPFVLINEEKVES